MAGKVGATKVNQIQKSGTQLMNALANGPVALHVDVS